MNRRVLCVSFLAFPLAFACSKGPANAERKMPKLAPPPNPVLNPGLKIAVEVNGAPSAALDAKKLETTPPDFEDAERVAWKLETLIGASKAPSYFAVTGEQNVTVELRPPPDGKLQPVLLMTRRGGLTATLVDPTDPFPPFHGQGGRLGRPGDTLPRVSEVTKISVRRGP
ncbi:MAG: hypothetical protein ACT4TC_08040 [Myxococcaceae bacterium]